MANINISIPDELHKELRIAAAKEEKTIKQLVIETLESYARDEK